jgi:hypothetical protein
VTCDRCGEVLEIGTYPFCPHGSAHAGRGADVTWPGGKVFENLANEPVTFYSPREKAQYLKRTNQEEFVRHMPVPGSDKSPHTTKWAAMSAETLAGAKEMLERVGKSSSTAEQGTYIKEFSVTISDVVEPARGSLS